MVNKKRGAPLTALLFAKDLIVFHLNKMAGCGKKSFFPPPPATRIGAICHFLIIYMQK
jgi:hypothetical protein